MDLELGLGEFAALAAAFMWTLSSMIWGRIHLSALALNFFKNWIGVAMILIHLTLTSLILGKPLFSAPATSWIWLGFSGFVGVVIGDTFYFRSLQIVGPRKALMVATTAPLFSAVLANLLLKETLKPTTIVGILLAVTGVIVVVADRRSQKESPGLMPGKESLGILAGIMGAVCQAIGGVFSKKGMVNEAGTTICSAEEATFIRLLIAAVATLVLVFAARRLKPTLESGAKAESIKLLIPATALGTWLGIWLSQLAYQSSANVAIAQTLLATCPLFAIPVVWITYRQKVSLYSIAGTCVALVGIFLTVMN